MSTVFLAATTDESVALAAAFGVGAFEMGKHRLDAQKAGIGRLTELFGKVDARNFQRLAGNGFDFFYMPNGWQVSGPGADRRSGHGSMRLQGSPAGVIQPLIQDAVSNAHG